LAKGGGSGALSKIIVYVIIIFVLFLFATSGLIANSNTQTQLKNSAYYLGLFASLIAILIAVDFVQHRRG
jgi:NADH:ubiquinone oxidoreductase subunit 6 (subunit J)